MGRASPSTRRDFIPLADRIRYLQGYRFAAAAVATVAWGMLPELRDGSFAFLGVVTATYLLTCLAASLSLRLTRRIGPQILGGLLLLDGLWVATVLHMTGGPTSPLRALVLCHLIVVALLASFRTGIKIAAWHTLLMLVTYHAEEAGVFASLSGRAASVGDAEYRAMIVNVAILWLVTLTTATFAAVNERDLRRRQYDLEALARLSLRYEQLEAPDEIGDALAEAVIDDFGFHRAVLVGFPSDVVEVLAQRNTVASVPTTTDLPDGSLIQEVRRTGETRLTSRLLAVEDAWLDRVLDSPRNVVAVPLRAEERVVGVLVAEHGKRTGSRIERRVISTLERFVSQTALALTNAWLLEQVRALASRDSLTGVANRRMLEETLGRELTRATRSGRTLSLLILDVDHFKAVNDTYGHPVGDAVLRMLGETLTAGVRGADVVARWGGEEFAVVLPELDLEDAVLAAERLRRDIEARKEPVPVTASFGVACFPAHGTDVAGLISAADRALYVSKRDGRNRVTRAALEAPPAPQPAAVEVLPGVFPGPPSALTA